MDTYYLSIDIGGTAIKAGILTADGKVINKTQTPNRVLQDGATAIVEDVAGIVKECQSRMELAGVAIATAGIVDAAQGKIIYANERNFPGYSGMELALLIKEATGLPVAVENDVNAAALGEYWRGAAQQADSVFMVTIGTGLGGAFVLDGNVWHGVSGSAGEMGFMRVHGEQRVLEEIASTRSMLQEAAFSHNMSPAELLGETVFKWAADGDADAVLALEHMIDNFSEGLANVYCLLNPEVIVLGGGIMAQQDYLYPRIKHRIEDLVVPSMRDQTKLVVAELGNDAGMVGALYHLLHPSKA